MESADPTSSAFDELLDLRFRGERVDADAFLAAHPDLSEEERDQIRRFCRTRAQHEPSSPTEGVGGADSPDQSPPVPRLGGYRLGRRLGAGGMGAVFLAQDESLGRPVAVKILGPDLLGTGERSERFLREARAVARLRHPNIVDVYAAGEQDGFRYLAMEFLRGASLHELIADAAARGTRLAVGDLVRWGIEIARALEAAHQAHVVHRDVKPSNIRITEDARAVLLDFGLALEDGAATLTESGAFRGSPQYASPEQVGVAGVAIDARTDVYSLGATLYEGLTGVAPFRGETREQLFNHILSSEPAPPRKLDPSIPKDLETVVLAALDKDPARRYPSAAALAADLEAFRDGRPISVRPISAPGRLLRWARRQPVKAGLAAIALVAILAAAVLAGYLFPNLERIDRAAAAERQAELAAMLEAAYLEYGEGGDPRRAVPMFEAALRLDPQSSEAHAGRALARIAAGDPEAVVAELTSAPAPRESARWREMLRAEALERLGRRAEADEILKDLPPFSTALDSFVLGMLHLSRFHHGGKPEAAAFAFEHLRRAVQSSPTAKALYHHELGHAAWHAKRHREAREEADIVRTLFPDTPEQRFAIAQMLQEADPQAALAAFERAAATPPRPLSARNMIAVQLAKSGQDHLIEAASTIAREMVARNPESPLSHGALGSVAFARNDGDAAIAAFQAGVRANPSYYGSHRMLAEAHLLNKDLAAARAPARESARLHPDAKSWNILGLTLTEPDELDEAIACFEKSLAAEPDVAEPLCNLGRALQRRGEFAKGYDVLRKGHEKGSKDPKWRYPQSKNWVAAAKRLADLEKKWEALRAGEGDPPAIHERIAFAHEICRTKKRYAEAVKLYEESFSIDPDLAAPAGLKPTLHLRRFAAACAFNAGVGEGVDAPADSAGRARLRERARTWFDEDVTALEEGLRGTNVKKDVLEKFSAAWGTDPAISRTRAPSAHAALADAEVAAWARVWARWAALPSPAESRVSR